jgi:hypothetical protein
MLRFAPGQWPTVMAHHYMDAGPDTPISNSGIPQWSSNRPARILAMVNKSSLLSLD